MYTIVYANMCPKRKSSDSAVGDKRTKVMF
jgi:hypothetical protein